MHVATLPEVQADLSGWIRRLSPGDELIITQDNQPVARLSVPATASKKPRRLGTLKGTVTHMSHDFDAPLPEFAPYMP